jgi:hypothetical protein
VDTHRADNVRDFPHKGVVPDSLEIRPLDYATFDKFEITPEQITTTAKSIVTALEANPTSDPRLVVCTIILESLHILVPHAEEIALASLSVKIAQQQKDLPHTTGSNNLPQRDNIEKSRIAIKTHNRLINDALFCATRDELPIPNGLLPTNAEQLISKIIEALPDESPHRDTIISAYHLLLRASVLHTPDSKQDP